MNENMLEIEYNYAGRPSPLQDQLRNEARNLYENCLAEGRTDHFYIFIEQQVLQSPPPIDLLYTIAEDLQQRFLTLREYYFDVREKVVRAFNETYHADLSAVTPPSEFDLYHTLTPDDLVASAWESTVDLTPKEVAILYRMVEASLKICTELHQDIELTAQLQSMLSDWLTALHIRSARKEQGSVIFGIQREIDLPQ